MPRLDQERHYLAQADQHIAEGKLLIGNLRTSIARRRVAGEDASRFEETLAVMSSELSALIERRDQLRSSVEDGARAALIAAKH